MPKIFYPTQRDLATPADVERAFRRALDGVTEENRRLQRAIDSIQVPNPSTPSTTPPPGESGVTGSGGSSGAGGTFIVPDYEIALPSASSAKDGELAWFENTLYRFESDPSPGEWVASGGGTPTTPITTVQGPNGTIWQDFILEIGRIHTDTEPYLYQCRIKPNLFFFADGTPATLPYCTAIRNPPTVMSTVPIIGSSVGFTHGIALNSGALNQILFDTADMTSYADCSLTANMVSNNMTAELLPTVFINDPTGYPLNIAGQARRPLILSLSFNTSGSLRFDIQPSVGHTLQIQISGWLKPLPA